MAGPLPNVPANFLVQAGNAEVYLSWDPVASATGYTISRSPDGVTYSTLVTQTATNYYDTTGVIGTEYWYVVLSTNANGNSSNSAPQTVTPVNYGQVSLGSIRLAAQQRADMVNNNFITKEEWNSYISKSYAALYDILVQTYGDEYYVATPYQFNTDGRYPALYPLPATFYKLLGVDLSISAGQNAWLTLKKFTFLERNKYIYGNTPVSWLGVLQLKYRLVGQNLELVPTPQANQTIQLWYIPRPSVLLADSDILDGVSGWDEYIVIDAAIKGMQKEESDVSVLMAQKAEIVHRIEAAASNRDVGEPERVTDSRSVTEGYWGGPFGDGPMGGA